MSREWVSMIGCQYGGVCVGFKSMGQYDRESVWYCVSMVGCVSNIGSVNHESVIVSRKCINTERVS